MYFSRPRAEYRAFGHDSGGHRNGRSDRDTDADDCAPSEYPSRHPNPNRAAVTDARPGDAVRVS